MKKLFVLILGLSLLSCSDDDELTQGELNAQRLNQVISGRVIESFTIREGSNDFPLTYQDPNYSIEGTFFRIGTGFGQDYYNLEKLIRIRSIQGGAFIELYFE